MTTNNIYQLGLKRKNILLIAFFLTLISFQHTTHAEIINGVIYDAETKEPLPFVNILVVNTVKGAVTDFDGQFHCDVNKFPCSLLVKFIGYESKELLLSSKEADIKIYLEKDVHNLSEITVKPDNLLDLILLRRIILNRKFNNPDNLNKIRYRNYERASVFISNINTEKVKSSKLFKKYANVMVTSSDSTVMMPFFINETITNHYRIKKEKIDRSEIVVEKSDGILTQINEQIKTTLNNNLTTEFNFYNNQINILQKGFPSPISSSSQLYYNVYITDSITRDNIKYFKFEFYPKSYKNTTFKGHFWVENQTWALTEIKASLPNSANLNFVSDFSVAVNYKKNTHGKWFYKEQKINLNLSLFKEGDKSKQFVVQRLNTYNELQNQPFINKLEINASRLSLSDSIIAQERLYCPLDTFESSAYTGIHKLKNNTFIKAVDKLSAMTLSGFYNLNKIDLGPYFGLYRKNEIEGDRITLPLRTSKKLFNRFMVGGYLGYGFKNKGTAYGSNIAYQFKKEKRTIVSSHFYDDYFELTNNKFIEFIKENPYQQGSGNMISALTSKTPNPYIIKNRHIDITLEHQLSKSIGLLLRTSCNRYYSNYNLHFKNNAQYLPYFDTQNILFDTRFSFSQDYDEGFFSRIYYGDEKPVFHFTAILGRYNLSKTNGLYGHINASMKSRVNIGPAFIKTLIEGGGIIGNVPYPLLNMPRGTRNIGVARYHYNLLYHASYASDIYINTHLTLNGGGTLFNKLPLIKHLDLREIFTFKAYYGQLLGKHNQVLELPNYLHTKTMEPYMEISAGITNIFKCFRIDYVQRLNTAESFNKFSSKHGIRFRFEVSF